MFWILDPSSDSATYPEPLPIPPRSSTRVGGYNPYDIAKATNGENYNSMNKQAFQMSRMIYAGMLVAALIYVAIAEKFGHARENFNSILLLALGIMATVDAGVVVFIRQRTPVLTEDDAVVGKWRTNHILMWSLTESVVILGLILRLVGASTKQASGFYILGLILFALNPPRSPAAEFPVSSS